jgi:hypothetical protein
MQINITAWSTINHVIPSRFLIIMPRKVAYKKGNNSYERNGELSEDFSTAEADNVIELNGIKSELVIYTSSDNSNHSNRMIDKNG